MVPLFSDSELDALKNEQLSHRKNEQSHQQKIERERAEIYAQLETCVRLLVESMREYPKVAESCGLKMFPTQSSKKKHFWSSSNSSSVYLTSSDENLAVNEKGELSLVEYRSSCVCRTETFNINEEIARCKQACADPTPTYEPNFVKNPCGSFANLIYGFAFECEPFNGDRRYARIKRIHSQSEMQANIKDWMISTARKVAEKQR